MANQRKGGSAAQNKRTKLIVTVAVIAVALLITFAPYMNLPFDIPTWGELLSGDKQTVQDGDALNAPFTVHVIDVGQGDSILLKNGDHAMLIDAGERGNDQKILDYLRANSVEKLDYIVATHPHSDHIGSMPKVIEGIEVDNVIMPKLPKSMVPTTSIYQKLIKAVKASGAKVISAKAGDTYTLGDAKITVVGGKEREADTCKRRGYQGGCPEARPPRQQHIDKRGVPQGRVPVARAYILRQG